MHIRVLVCGTVSDTGDLTTGGSQEGDNRHEGDGWETSDT